MAKQKAKPVRKYSISKLCQEHVDVYISLRYSHWTEEERAEHAVKVKNELSRRKDGHLDYTRDNSKKVEYAGKNPEKEYIDKVKAFLELNAPTINQHVKDVETLRVMELEKKKHDAKVVKLFSMPFKERDKLIAKHKGDVIETLKHI